MNRREKVNVILDEVESDIADVKKDVLTAIKQFGELQTLLEDDDYALGNSDKLIAENLMCRIESLLDDIENGLRKIEDSLY